MAFLSPCRPLHCLQGDMSCCTRDVAENKVTLSSCLAAREQRSTGHHNEELAQEINPVPIFLLGHSRDHWTDAGQGASPKIQHHCWRMLPQREVS